MPEQPGGMRHRPLLLGHRGARVSDRRIPENTIAAFDLTLQRGCDGFEFDVRCTKDGRLLICHDPEFMGRNVAATSYEELQEQWERGGVPKLLYRARADIPEELVEIPCLEDVLERYRDNAFLDIELKIAGMQKAVVAALRELPPKRGYVVSSFLPEALFEVRAQDAGIPLGFICDQKKELARWTTLPVEYVMPHHKLLSARLLEELHAAGKKILVWTVNDRRDMLRFAEWGIDGIISDDPQLLASAL
jgi:glycerophosphoryl diester phosphodiesterase